MSGDDSYVQLPADGSGKLVDNVKLPTGAGATIYRQRVEVADPVASTLSEIAQTLVTMLAVQRAMLFALTDGEVTETDFLDQE